MKLRSFLFVPGDRPERIEKALLSGADAVIVDLEDSVAPQRKAFARECLSERFAAGASSVPLFVRINPLYSDDLEDDLNVVRGGALTGIVLPKAESGSCVSRLIEKLGSGSSAVILPIATETPRAIFGLGTYDRLDGRLCALTWGAEDLPAAVGAFGSRDAEGRFTAPYELARSLALFGASAAGVPAIETVFPDVHDLKGLRAYAMQGKRDGFSGMLAIHPSQVAVINDSFRPTADELELAREIVALFSSNPGAGALQHRGRMVDRPHFALALRVLSRE